MYRLGHTGIALLVLAPLAYVLLEAHRPLLAFVTVLGVLAIEPLPDLDFKFRFLDHRGVSHSLLAAVTIGGILALCGWVVVGQVSTALPSVFTTVSEAVRTAATSLQSLTPSGATGRIAGLLRTVADGLGWTGSQLQSLDRQTVAGYGFIIGAGGILVHLLGDVLTVSGIRLFLPFSSRRISLSSLHANNPLANTGLFACGVVAIAVVLSLTVGGAGFAVPADLSPVGAAAGQNQTTTQSASSNATVAFANQTSNGSTVTIANATLPDSGFIVIHDSEHVENRAPAEASVIAVSEPLDAGTHRNVTVDISHAPPGNYPGLNRSRLNRSQPLAATVYRDTNANRRFDYVQSYGENDTAYINATDGQPVSDEAGISVPSAEEERRTASVTFANQTLQNETLVVERARLPEGGFLVAHNQSYQRTGDPLTSAVGLSGYLPPGNHTNVRLDVLPGALNETQVVTIRPAKDTNDNQQYDYVQSDGFRDIAYETLNRSDTVSESAQVSVPSGQATESPAQTSPSTTTTSTPSSTPSDGLFDSLGLLGVASILAVLVAGIIVIRRVS